METFIGLEKRLKVDTKRKRFILFILLILCSCSPVVALADDDFQVFDEVIAEEEQTEEEFVEIQEEDNELEIDYVLQEEYMTEEINNDTEDNAPENHTPIQSKTDDSEQLDRIEEKIDEVIKVGEQSFEILDKSDNDGENDVDEDFEVMENDDEVSITPTPTPDLIEVIRTENQKQMIVIFIACGLVIGFFMIQRMLD